MNVNSLSNLMPINIVISSKPERDSLLSALETVRQKFVEERDDSLQEAKEAWGLYKKALQELGRKEKLDPLFAKLRALKKELQKRQMEENEDVFSTLSAQGPLKKPSKNLSN